MSYKYYLVTIKTRGTPYTVPLELYDMYDKAKDMMRLTEWSDLRVLEMTDTKRLHLHTICITQDNIYRVLQNCSTKRCYIHFKEFPASDWSKVRDYLLKQVKDRDAQSDIIYENFFDNENAFYFIDKKCTHYLSYLIEQYNRHPIYNISS